MRVAQNSHGEPIRSAIKLNKSDEEYTSLSKFVFGHHEINNFQAMTSDQVDIANKLKISKYFHNHHFLPVKVFQGTDPSNPTFSEDELVNRLTRASWGQGHNDVDFFVGGIGSGKTTFLCNLIFTNYRRFLHDRTIPVRINLDVEDDHSVKSLSEQISLILNSIITHIEVNGLLSHDATFQLKKGSRLFGDEDAKEIDSHLSYLLEALFERHNYRVLLIIDNIDFLYHLGDRGFFSNIIHEDQRTAYNAITDLINFLWRKRGEYRTASLGINVVFAVRKDTLEFIRSRQQEVPIPDLDELVFSISESAKEDALKVVEARFEMLSELVKLVPDQGKRLEFLNTTQLLSKAYREPTRAGIYLFDDLWRLCRRGLRDIIDQMADYSWLEFHDERRQSATLRFATQYYPSIIAYGTDGHRRYSQFAGNLPNLFLINAAVKSNEFAVDPNFKATHLYTMWLKWLMLSYVDAQKGKVITSDNVIDALCGKNRRAYSEGLVRYVLGALTEVPAAELIEVDVGADGDGGRQGFVRNLYLTKRGDFLLNSFCKTFSYFQMVVDDWRLLIPEALRSDFEFLEPDYKYLVAPDGDYGRQVRQVIERKGLQSLKFAILVDRCGQHERALYPKVFERLAQNGVELPTDDFFFSAVRSDLERAAKAVRADDTPFSENSEWVGSYVEKCDHIISSIFAPAMNLQRDFYSAEE